MIWLFKRQLPLLSYRYKFKGFSNTNPVEVKRMRSLSHCPSEIDEIERLNRLLPIDERSRVKIIQSPEVTPVLMTIEVSKHQFAIQIDFACWHQLKSNHRDLLFCHEISRIQQRTVSRFTGEMPLMGVGLLFSLLEISAHNLISLSITLVVTVLVGNQLYQRNRGERSLRAVVAADRQAIDIAMRSGYSFSKAFTSLYDALEILAETASEKPRWKKYQVRIKALEISASQQKSTNIHLKSA
ncbi:MAG: DUF3318 domain-containing protein [Nostocaceae cyanobacterium]|nr:DUF3318 domain-containing protein [Nostocaceae cyanobacterium]